MMKPANAAATTFGIFGHHWEISQTTNVAGPVVTSATVAFGWASIGASARITASGPAGSPSSAGAPAPSG